jgi:UDP-N-acetylglucosamine acyltransferase
MAYAHIAHNCTVGNGVVLANSVNMAGHVAIGDHATVGGVTVIHQFVRIGQCSIIGGGLRIPMDIVPYAKVGGYPAKINGLNVVGLERRGFSAETRRILKDAYRLLFRSNLNVTQAVERVRSDVPQIPEVLDLIGFIEGSRRGITL